jgi:hypothetical protein
MTLFMGCSTSLFSHELLFTFDLDVGNWFPWPGFSKLLMNSPRSKQPLARSPGHGCRYLTNRIPLRTGFKTIQGVGCASMCCHVSCSFESYPPVEVGSSVETCHMAPDPTSLPRWAPTLPHVQWLRTLTPG